MEDYYDNEYMNNNIDAVGWTVSDNSPNCEDDTVLSDAEIDAEIFAGQVMKMLKKAA